MDELDQPCAHWEPPFLPFFGWRPLPGRRCYECEAEEYAAWQASVKARLERGLSRIAQGLDSGWDLPLSA